MNPVATKMTNTFKPTLNRAQLFLLQTFANIRDDKEMQEIESLFLDYIRKKVDCRAEKLWDELNLTDEKIEEMLNSHERTPYR